jgi:hypothetical protein
MIQILAILAFMFSWMSSASIERNTFNAPTTAGYEHVLTQAELHLKFDKK